MTSRDINTYMVASPYPNDSLNTSGSDKKTLIKPKGSKAALQKKLAIAIPIAVVGGAIAIIGIVFFAYYFGSLDAVAKDGFCMNDLSCSSNMVCLYGKCSCSNGTSWNSSYCVNSTNSTVTNTTVTNKFLLIFSGSPYKNTSLTTYAGSLLLGSTSDLFVVDTTQIMYLVMDYTNMVLIFYDEYGNYLRYTYIQDGAFVTAYNGYYYITTYSSTYGYIHKYDMNSIWITSYFVGAFFLGGLTYNAKSDYLYICDQTNNMIKAFDKNLNYNASQSFSLTGVMDIGSSQGFLYVGLNNNSISIYNGNTLVTTYSNVCKSGSPMFMYNLYVHSDSGYMLVSCFADKKVNLWYTNGTMAYFTGLYVPTSGNPRGASFDSKGQVIVSMISPNRTDILALK